MALGRFDRFVNPMGHDRFAVDFPEPVRLALDHLAGQLEENLDSDHPDLHRLFPTAYNNDAERDAGYQILARPQLVDGKREAIRVVRETIDNQELTGEELSCWMRVINDIRLVMGTRLDVSEDQDDPTPDHPDADVYEVYHVLGLMLEHIVSALSAGL